MENKTSTRTPFSMKVVILYLAALMILNAYNYTKIPAIYYIVLIVVNAVIVYGLFYRNSWAWILLGLSSLVSLVNPFPAIQGTPVAAGSLYAAFQFFNIGKNVNGGVLIYASIFGIATLAYAFYGWKMLSKASAKTDKAVAWILAIIFLINLSGIIKIFFGESFTWDMLIAVILYLGLLIAWESWDNQSAGKTKEVKKRETQDDTEEMNEDDSEEDQEEKEAKSEKKSSKQKKAKSKNK